MFFWKVAKIRGGLEQKKAQGRTDLDVSERACASGRYASVLIHFQLQIIAPAEKIILLGIKQSAEQAYHLSLSRLSYSRFSGVCSATPQCFKNGKLIRCKSPHISNMGDIISSFIHNRTRNHELDLLRNNWCKPMMMKPCAKLSFMFHQTFPPVFCFAIKEKPISRYSRSGMDFVQKHAGNTLLFR